MGKRRSKKDQVRANFRKNRAARTRQNDLTRQFENRGAELEDADQGERLSGKGELTRGRMIRAERVEEGDEAGFGMVLEVDESICRQGRVLAVRGLISTVEDQRDGTLYQCATRRLLKTLSTDQRHIVAAGDRVLFRAVENTDENTREGIIERVEPRHGTVCRTSRSRRHIIVTNVDQVLIVTSAAEPRLKPNLIDRLIITAEKAKIQPVICINKIDLVDPTGFQPLIGTYAQMGYPVLLLSAQTDFGIESFRRRMQGRASVVAGQSGVGKSSLLNRVDPTLHLRVQEVSTETHKGRHTTTTAELIPLRDGGYVVDTPGIRQFQLWDVIREEVPGFFRDIRAVYKFLQVSRLHAYA